ATVFDERVERPRAVRVLEAHQLRRTQDLAAVEGRDLESLQPLVRDFLELLVAVAFGAQPQKVLDLDAARVARRADRLEVVVHPLAKRVVVLELEIGLPEVERADVANRHQRVRARGLGVGEDARVQMKVVVGFACVNVAGAAARDRLELVELDPELWRERLRGGVELLRGERREAALVVADLHSSLFSSLWFVCSMRASARAPWTMPAAPLTPRVFTTSEN